MGRHHSYRPSYLRNSRSSIHDTDPGNRNCNRLDHRWTLQNQWGAFATVLPSPLRSLNVTGGVIAFVLGIAALFDLQAAVATLIGILAVALLLVGAVEIGVGVARHPPVWLRLLIVAIGVLTIILSVYVILDMSIGQGILVPILALALMLVGIRNIVHGITGHHSIATPVEAAVTAA